MKRPALSKGELEVARALWDLKKASVRQVFESIPSERAMDFTTVQTYLRRLESKGYLSARLVGRTRIYTTRVKPQTVIRDTITDLVDRLFGGEAMPLMQHLIEDHGMSDDDITYLKTLLDDLQADTKK